MKKVLYAIGHEDTEKALTTEISADYEVVGTVIYKEALIGHLEQVRPDVLILREQLPGSLPILDLTYTIRTQMPDIRIVFIAEKKLPGDSLLSALVGFGIYDILASDKIRLSEIVDCIRKPRTLGEAAAFQTPFSASYHGKAARPAPKMVQPEKKRRFGLFNKEEKEESRKDNNAAKEKERQKAIRERERLLKEREAEIERLREEELEKIERLKKESQEEIERQKQALQKKVHTAAHIEKPVEKEREPEKPAPTKAPETPPKEAPAKPVVLERAPGRADSACQVIAFMGAKHGVGNTTIALNTASVLASKYKVLFIEINERYPVTSYLFEFDNTTTGLEEAAKAAKSGKGEKVEAMIEKPKKKQAPANLHFLPFSNSILIAEKENRSSLLDIDGLKAIIAHVLERGYYEYIILDIQPDDRYVGEGVLDGRLIVDHLFLTITQEAHSIGCAVYKKDAISTKAAFLLGFLSFVVNMYNDKSQVLLPQIADGLEVEESSIIPVVLDHAHLIDSSLNGEIYAKGSRGEAFLPIIARL